MSEMQVQEIESRAAAYDWPHPYRFATPMFLVMVVLRVVAALMSELVSGGEFEWIGHVRPDQQGVFHETGKNDLSPVGTMSFIRRAAAAVKYSFTEPEYQQLKYAEDNLQEDGVVSILAAVNTGWWSIESKETIRSRVIGDLDELEEYRSQLRQQMAA